MGNTVITKRSNGVHDELYLHKDNQGSTISITNGSGAVLQQFIYDPWGKQYSVSSNSLFTTYSNPGTSKGYTGHNMVNDFEVIHMNGRTYNPILGRFMQADPFIQAPSNLQNYNRYSYVLNNPMSYTDPSGYFFKKLKKFVKKYWKAAVAIAVTVATYGAASGWAAGWGMTQGFSMTVMGTTSTFVTGLSTAGAMTAGAIAGAAGGFVGGALATGSLRGAVNGAISGAATGAASGAISGMGVSNKDILKRMAISSAGGCAAGAASGGSCKKGANMAALSQSLSISIEMYTTSKPTYKTPSNKNGTFKPSDKAIVDEKYCVYCDVVDSDSNNIGVGLRANAGEIVGSLTPNDTHWKSIAEGGPGSRALASIPGFNSGAIFHDVFVGHIERTIGMHQWSSNAQLIGGLFTNQMTIIPGIALNYVALGVKDYEYYYNNVKNN
ncbi:RHS repeat domain-containing protein [Rheinheimera sp. WS51]|uniref:RHS repeat domain-containing protein n=1 Tax=Rheinheimera sp. WS51 TaxID=3425886 RepID=UPI003D8B11F8